MYYMDQDTYTVMSNIDHENPSDCNNERQSIKPVQMLNSIEYDNYDYLYKIILVGTSNIGKTALVNHYFDVKDNFGYSTLGVEFYVKNFEINDTKIKSHIWDTAGQEKFYSITKSYFRNATGALLCFSIVDRRSFSMLERYINDIKELCIKNVSIILVGTYADMADKRSVSIAEINKFVTYHNIEYIEISSVTGANVDYLFDSMFQKTYGLVLNGEMKLDKKEKNVSVTNKHSGCC